MSEAEIHALDEAYVPFPNFKDWAAATVVDTARWDNYYQLLQLHSKASSELLAKAVEVAKRAAAFDTGAIEGLYETDRGFTYSVAVETAVWDTRFAENTQHVRSMFEAQLAAYDYVLSLATGAQQISEAAIRALHEQVCAAQETYEVNTAVGKQIHQLPKGQYKTYPNHVTTTSGAKHSYAPVAMTSSEMSRLISEFRTEAFGSAHPISQAAYAHYCLVCIHPFGDGNGRVARAFASSFTYKSISMPIVIFTEEKKLYHAALEAADSGDYQSFMTFMTVRILETIQLVVENLRAASAPDARQSIEAIQHLYVTRGGYTYEQIDAAADKFMAVLLHVVSQASSNLSTAKVSLQCSLQGGTHYEVPVGYRVPAPKGSIAGGKALILSGSSTFPAMAAVRTVYCLALPKNAAGEDDVQLIQSSNTGKPDVFLVRIDQIIPDVSASLQIRLQLFAERIIKETFATLRVEAEKSADKNRRR